MSYIINNSQQFILAKLTKRGRELLSKGNLTFSQWSIGDSEINYNVTGQTQNFLIPKDEQQDLKYFIKNSSDNLMNILSNQLTTENIKLINRRVITTTGTPMAIDWSSNINWDSNLLQFNPSCVFNEDIIGWYKQNVYKSSIIGTTGNTNQYFNYKNSSKYLGQFNILDDDSSTFSNTSGLNPCLDYSESIVDNNKSMSIIYFQQDKVFNYYSEELYIDPDNLFKIYIPNLDYHRTVDTTGMTFISDTTLKYLGSNELKYYDLLEEIDKTIDDKAKIVGRVFPGLQIATFNDDEIVAALEDSSKRKYTLPELQISLLPTNKTGEIILEQNEVLYSTYLINDSVFPCQNITKSINLSQNGKYIKVDLSSEMKNSVNTLITGVTFLWQKVTSINDLPSIDGWNKLDITSYYHNKQLENLYLKNNDLKSNKFSLIDYNIDLTNNEVGTSSFLKSTISTSYNVNNYKSVFKFNLSSTEFSKTTNPTYQDAINNGVQTNIKVSEIGIYADNDELVMIGKIGYPIDLALNSTITIHMEMDF